MIENHKPLAAHTANDTSKDEGAKPPGTARFCRVTRNRIARRRGHGLKGRRAHIPRWPRWMGHRDRLARHRARTLHLPGGREERETALRFFAHVAG